MFNVINTQESTQVKRSDYAAAGTVYIDQVYDIALGDQIDFDDGSVGIVQHIGPCPYYGYEHYPAAYIVEESGAWSEYIILDLYPDTTLASFDSIYTRIIGWELVEPKLLPFDTVQPRLEYRSALQVVR